MQWLLNNQIKSAVCNKSERDAPAACGRRRMVTGGASYHLSSIVTTAHYSPPRRQRRYLLARSRNPRQQVSGVTQQTGLGGRCDRRHSVLRGGVLSQLRRSLAGRLGCGLPGAPG